MRFENNHPADQIATIMKRIYSSGMTTTSGGNLSIIDDKGDIWITPAGVDKSSLRREDIVCVKTDSTISGIHRPSSELPIHRLAYKVRPDMKAVLHAHSPSLVSFCIVGKVPDTHLVPGIDSICGKPVLVKYAIPGSKKLGEKVANALKKGANTVILENHGVVVGGESLLDAFKAFETLDYCAQLHICASSIGKTVTLSNNEASLKEENNIPELIESKFCISEKAIRQEMIQRIQQAYDMRFITSIQGDFSQRLDDNGFIITPHGMDRKNIQENDLVLIKFGSKEAGKLPSSSVKLHQYIYERHSEINSIVIAQPPGAMTFAVTEADFDSRIIPESYILLRDTPRLSYGSFAENAEIISNTLSSKRPVIFINNKCIIITGNNLLNVYDKLEVLEYSAKSIIMSKNIGKISSICEKDITDIDEAFNLNNT